MQNQTRLLILTLGAGLFAAGVWFWYLTRSPFNEADFGSLTGTLRSAAEHRSGKSVFLEFYLVESPVRFRVPVDGYTSSFKREEFFRDCQPGTTITLQAEKAELANPSTPALDPVPTVFVHGLKDSRMAYCTLEGRRQWVERNQLYGLGFAIFLSVLAAFFGFLFARRA